MTIKNSSNVIHMKAFGTGAIIGRTPDRSCSLLLQRQGCSSTLNCSHRLFFIEFVPLGDGEVRANLNYSNVHGLYGSRFAGQVCKSGKYSSIDSAKANMKNHIKKHFECDVVFLNSVMDYCPSFGHYKYQESDVVMSPLKVSPKGIVDVFGNVVLPIPEQIKDKEEFQALQSEIANADDFSDENMRNSLQEAFKKGFHECDYKRGMKACVQRLAWLAGQYFIDAEMQSSGQLKCMVLQRDMTNVSRLL